MSTTSGSAGRSPEPSPCPPLLVEVYRDGAVESVHRGHAIVAGSDGRMLRSIGADPVIYIRSAIKPFQTLAVLDLLADVGRELPPQGIAIASASHQATDDQVIEAAHLLAQAGLDESALQCPAALPADEASLAAVDRPERIAYNCSGKHAAFLLAQVAAGGDPANYLDPDSPVQRRVRERIAEFAGVEPAGPGVDGCGAPAWRLPLSGLARAFALLAGATEGRSAAVLAGMRSRPDLVGGPGSPDTALMAADGRVVAKRGAEAVFGAGATGVDAGTIGIAVKIDDGGSRAVAPVAAALLREAGAQVPDAVIAPPVLGGGRARGTLVVHLPTAQ